MAQALTDFEAVPPLKTEKELHQKAEGRISAVVYATPGKLRDILCVARFALRRASAWQSAVGEREFDVHMLLVQLSCSAWSWSLTSSRGFASGRERIEVIRAAFEPSPRSAMRTES